MYQTWQTILPTAARTPSPHNIQPWRLRLHDATHATLFFERRLMVPFTDATGGFMHAAMGSFLEALEIVAANNGYALQTTLLPPAEHRPREPFAELTLELGDVPKSYPDVLFYARRTARVPFSATPVPLADVHALQTVVAPWNQCYIHCDNPAQVERLLQRNTQTLIADLNDPRYHRELAPWLHANIRRRDGLEARCMAVHAAELLAVKHAPGLLVAPVIGGVLRKRYEHTLGSAPAIGVLGGPFWMRDVAVRAGRALLRFWLETARLGLAIHPLGNLITNSTARAAVAAELGRDDSWLVFKIGVAPNAPLSQRYPVKDMLV